jgi:hypothetical protein
VLHRRWPGYGRRGRSHLEPGNARSLGIGSTHISDHTGIGVPIFVGSRHVVAAISCSVLSGRFLGDKRSRMVAIMQSEAQIIGGQINPLDPILVSPIRR